MSDSPLPPFATTELGLVHAPDFPAGLTWLNTDRPLRLHHELRGRVVLLDFWSYCCINCLHTLPELNALEEEFRGEPFSVIGVHCGKFDDEKDPARIRSAVERYGVKHPVIVDSGFDVWDAYAIRGWPTIALVDAEGYLVVRKAGEPDREGLRKAIRYLLKSPLPLGEGQGEGQSDRSSS